jgi:hypothetical protein
MHDFYFGYTRNIKEQLWKVLAQKADLLRKNEFLICMHPLKMHTKQALLRSQL